jgi:hypothetical protein
VKRTTDEAAQEEAELNAKCGQRTMAKARRALIALLQQARGTEAVRGRRVRPPRE